jgi:2-polyprenyl-3-methyl-5-hydroxy-6-metoxy-1,4-benzoquinol methylase
MRVDPVRTLVRDTATTYRERVYAFQTKARGLREKEQLVRVFEKLRPFYQCKLRGTLPGKRTSAILDLPCGYGNLSYFLAKSGYVNVEGVDSDPAQVALAKLVGIRAEVADGFEWLSARPDTYDAILSLDFIEHLTKEAALEFCELVLAALKKNGILIARTPCADGPFFGSAVFNDLTHEWMPTSGAARNLLRMCGFAKVAIVGDRPVPFKLVNVIRRIAFRMTCAVGSCWSSFAGLGVPAIWTPNMWIFARRGE